MQYRIDWDHLESRVEHHSDRDNSELQPLRERDGDYNGDGEAGNYSNYSDDNEMGKGNGSGSGEQDVPRAVPIEHDGATYDKVHTNESPSYRDNQSQNEIF